jgi:hypothetical protein
MCSHGHFWGIERMKISTILALLGLAAGLVSAWFWWRSSRTRFRIAFVSMITSGSPVPTARDIEAYLREVGSLNTKAALLGALSVTLSALAGIMASYP